MSERLLKEYGGALPVSTGQCFAGLLDQFVHGIAPNIHARIVQHPREHFARCNRVQAGEQLTVTDRGRAIALLAPVQRGASHDWAHAMVARGRARWSGGKPAGLTRRVRSRGKPASAMVIEDRR